ncbi:MAG: hypothetical protein V4606_02220 [Patescibacteria group bacterium]
MSYLCVRCGRERIEHDTNLVLETEEVLAEIGARDVETGFKLSLLDCSDSPRPNEYVTKMHDEGYFFGYGAGYVSSDPAAETKLYRESRPMFPGHTVTMLLLGGRVMDIGL